MYDSLFAGIGGMDYGLELAGWGVRNMCEIRDDARTVLHTRWPGARLFTDVRQYKGTYVDAIVGGFPCQNLSTANVKTRNGLKGEQSGLWFEFFRVITEAAPRWVVVENSGAGWRDWVPSVRSDLHSVGYTSVCLSLRACDFGAPFQGERAFVVATTNRNGEPTSAFNAKARKLSSPPRPSRKDWGAPSTRALGVADRSSRGVDRLRLVGNAVVPAMSEYIGRWVSEIDSAV